MLTFDSFYVSGPKMPRFTDEQIKNEPMFFSCSVDFAYDNGGPITKTFIRNLAASYRKGIFDSRTHMLMPGWYPCIPGWHHDDVPRSTKDGQPNYVNPEYQSMHCLALVNSDVAPTEFLVGQVKVPYPKEGKVVYEQWDKHINSIDKEESLIIEKAEDKLHYFNCDTFHRGTAAVRSGWRWFGRVSIDTHRKPTNEIRKQVQVYMPRNKCGLVRERNYDFRNRTK